MHGCCARPFQCTLCCRVIYTCFMQRWRTRALFASPLSFAARFRCPRRSRKARKVAVCQTIAAHSAAPPAAPALFSPAAAAPAKRQIRGDTTRAGAAAREGDACGAKVTRCRSAPEQNHVTREKKCCPQTARRASDGDTPNTPSARTIRPNTHCAAPF